MGQLTVIQTFMTAFGVGVAVVGLLTLLNLRNIIRTRASEVARETTLEMMAALRPAETIQPPDLAGLDKTKVTRRKAGKEVEE